MSVYDDSPESLVGLVRNIRRAIGRIEANQDRLDAKLDELDNKLDDIEMKADNNVDEIADLKDRVTALEEA